MLSRLFEGLFNRTDRAGIASVVLAMSVLTVSGASANGVKYWNMKSVTGNVQVKAPSGNWKPVRAGIEIVPGSRIKTDAAARAVLTRNGDVVEAAPNSEASFPERTGKTMPSVDQTKGTLIYKIVTRPSNRFNVKTPYLTAVIKGTVFSVTVNDKGGALHVTRGAVEVTSRLTGEIAMVRPGHTATVAATPGLRMKLLGGKGDRKTDGPKKEGKAKAGNAKSRAAAGRTIGKPLVASGGAAGKGLKRAVRAADMDVLKASKGLIGGPKHTPGNGGGGANSAKGFGASRASGGDVDFRPVNVSQGNHGANSGSKGKGKGNGKGKGKGKK